MLTRKEFDLLSRIEQIRLIDRELTKQPEPETVFGADQSKAKLIYHHLVQRTHPDYFTDLPEATASAVSATALLNLAWGKYNYHEVNHLAVVTPRTEIKLGPTVYSVEKLLGSGDFTDIYLALDQAGNRYVIKIAREAGDTPLIENEVKTLNHLNKSFGDDHTYRLKTVFRQDDRMGEIFTYNPVAFPDPAHLYTLTDIGNEYRHALPFRHLGWLWRRLMALLVYVHDFDVIHAAITPDNILVNPINHNLLLIDWTYSLRQREPLRLISSTWRSHYPPEVFNHQPLTLKADLFMAAKVMQWVTNVMPPPLNDYFNWCVNDNFNRRPDNARTAFNDWNTLIFDRLKWKRNEFIPLDYDPDAPQIDWRWWH